MRRGLSGGRAGVVQCTVQERAGTDKSQSMGRAGTRQGNVGLIRVVCSKSVCNTCKVRPQNVIQHNRGRREPGD